MGIKSEYGMVIINAFSSELVICLDDFFLFFPENRTWNFMQIVSIVDNLHEMSNSVFWGK